MPIVLHEIRVDTRDSDKFITKDEACRILRCSTSTLDRYVRDGILNRYRAPGRARGGKYLESEVFGVLRPEGQGE